MTDDELIATAGANMNGPTTADMVKPERTAEVARLILETVLQQIDYKVGNADGPSMVARMLARHDLAARGWHRAQTELRRLRGAAGGAGRARLTVQMCTAPALGVVFFYRKASRCAASLPDPVRISLPTEPRPHRRGFSLELIPRCCVGGAGTAGIPHPPAVLPGRAPPDPHWAGLSIWPRRLRPVARHAQVGAARDAAGGAPSTRGFPELNESIACVRFSTLRPVPCVPAHGPRSRTIGRTQA
jgi:hypothetical protein